MSFWSFDDKTQLALILAGLIGGAGATAGCDDGRPVPSDAGPHTEHQADGIVADMLPPDAQPDIVIADPLPEDASVDVPIADMLPPDASPDVPIADPLPPDASASSTPLPGAGFGQSQRAQRPGPQADRRSSLPLARDLRASIAARKLSDGVLRLQARAPAAPGARLRYRWKVSHGTLDSSSAAAVTWQLPAGPGRYLAQLTVRDGDRTVSVEVFVYTVE
jgi:hypothetical protein